MGITKEPENKRSQIDLLYRDIKIQMDELRDLRKYKAAYDELIKFLDSTYTTLELLEVEQILNKHIKK